MSDEVESYFLGVAERLLGEADQKLAIEAAKEVLDDSI